MLDGPRERTCDIAWSLHKDDTRFMRSGHFEAVRPFMDQEEVAALTCKVTFQCNPPTPAFAKAGAAPGTTAGVELVFLSFKCFNASRQLPSASRLPPQPSLVRALHAQPRTQKPHGHIMASWRSSKLPQGHINGVVQPAVRQALQASNPSNA